MQDVSIIAQSIALLLALPGFAWLIRHIGRQVKDLSDHMDRVQSSWDCHMSAMKSEIESIRSDLALARLKISNTERDNTIVKVSMQKQIKRLERILSKQDPSSRPTRPIGSGE